LRSSTSSLADEDACGAERGPFLIDCAVGDDADAIFDGNWRAREIDCRTGVLLPHKRERMPSRPR
jgi:hypothetical protein